MQPVFISYSHADSEFAERLLRDLHYASIPVTYDKWLLRVGESIIDRIATTVASAASVIAIISKNSITSEWVRKELSLAMVSEISGRAVRVLPALIDDCSLPASISDKLYADFRFSYYSGLRQLLEALDGRDRRERCGYSPFPGLNDIEQMETGLETALASNEIENVQAWIDARPHVLFLLVSHLWDFCEVISGFNFGAAADAIDYLIANGQSWKFSFTAISIGAPQCPDAANADASDAVKTLDRSGLFIKSCRKNYEEFCRAASIRFSEEQIGPSSFAGFPEKFTDGHRHKIHGIFFLGRRNQREYERLRQKIYAQAPHHHGVEIASYDRLLEALRKWRRLQQQGAIR